MNDILKRLRRWGHTGGCGCTRCTAANELERLSSEGKRKDAVIYAAREYADRPNTDTYDAMVRAVGVYDLVLGKQEPR